MFISFQLLHFFFCSSHTFIRHRHHTTFTMLRSPTPSYLPALVKSFPSLPSSPPCFRFPPSASLPLPPPFRPLSFTPLTSLKLSSPPLLLHETFRAPFAAAAARSMSGPPADAQVEELVKNKNSQNPLVVYSKTWCPYVQCCHDFDFWGIINAVLFTCWANVKNLGGMAKMPGDEDSGFAGLMAVLMRRYCGMVKGLFGNLGAQPLIVELDELVDEQEVQRALQNLTGQSTVPSVFIGGKHIGGCDDTMALHQKGDLIPLLKEAGVKFT